MIAPIPVRETDAQHHWAVTFGTLVLHTVAVYACAIHYFPWLVGRWFAWILPALHVYTSTNPVFFLSEHLAAISTIPAVILGYLVVRSKNSSAVWAWVVPTLVLGYEMSVYRRPGSVLYASSFSALKYFFEIQTIPGPSFRDLLTVDTERVLAQMRVTAPFYTGVAYSVGALVARQGIVKQLFSSSWDSQHDADERLRGDELASDEHQP